jgi:hypothetical protein
VGLQPDNAAGAGRIAYAAAGIAAERHRKQTSALLWNMTYFIEQGIASFVTMMTDGETIECAMFALFGDAASQRVIVQAPAPRCGCRRLLPPCPAHHHVGRFRGYRCATGRLDIQR